MNDISEIRQSSDRKSRTAGVIWGAAKCGKTTFLTSLPGKKLFVMIDPDGDSSIPDHPDIFIMRLYEHTDEEVIRFLKDKLPSMLRQNDDKFDSVIIDSLSTIGRAALRLAITNKVGAGKGFTPTIEAPGLSAYGARTNYLVDIVSRNLRATGSVGMHCWFTAHQDEAQTDDAGHLISITMTLSGKAINEIGLNVSEIWFMRMHDKKWHLAISPCRGREPMGSRMISMTSEPEFQLKFDPEKGVDQPHSISTWFNTWIASGKKKLEIPK